MTTKLHVQPVLCAREEANEDGAQEQENERHD
jgi:hypothetical protein